MADAAHGVDQSAIRDALKRARAAFPDATRFVPNWTPASPHGCVHVEVWRGDRANVVSIENMPAAPASVAA
jgi:hypothetical protein